MRQEDRQNLLWLGGDVPDALTNEVSRRGRLNILQVTEAELAAMAPAARGLVIEFNDDQELFLARVRRARELVLNQGLGIGLVLREGADRDLFVRLTDLKRVREDPLDRVRVFYLEWPRLVDWLTLDHNPGPGANEGVRVNYVNLDPDSLDPEIPILVKRAFHDCSEINVMDPSGGHSGATVLIVSFQRPGSGPPNRTLPFVGKVDLINRIRQEEDNFTRIVRNSDLVNYSPGVVPERSAYGARLGIFVQNFVPNGITFKVALQTGKVSQLIASVFDGALEAWRLCAQELEAPLQNWFIENKVLRRSDALEEAAEESRNLYGSEVNVDGLINSVEAVRPIGHLRCQIHGDLHAGNIFVTAGTTDVVLIDFYKTVVGPAVADPACLEVDLAFNPRVNEAFDPEFLLSLYNYPLGTPPIAVHTRAHAWLWGSIRAIRLLGCAHEVGCHAYILAIIVYLMRFASYADYPLDRRALAFFIAQRLMYHLHQDLGTAGKS